MNSDYTEVLLKKKKSKEEGAVGKKKVVSMVHGVVLPIQKDLFWISFDNDVYKALEAPGPGPGLGVGLHQGLVTPAEPVRPRLDLRVLTNCEFLKGVPIL